MTAREMQIAFDILVQTVSQSMEIQEKPDSFDIMYFLNLAQLRYIHTNFLSKGSVMGNIEAIQKRSDVLRNLVQRYTLFDTDPVTPLHADPARQELDGSATLVLPTDYLYYIKSYSHSTNTLKGVVSRIWTPNRIIDHEELAQITNNIYNVPILRKPCIVIESDFTLRLYKDRETSIFNYNMIYLKRPYTISLEATGIDAPTGYTDVCELDESTHSDIVSMAVNMFIEEYKYKLAQAPNK